VEKGVRPGRYHPEGQAAHHTMLNALQAAGD
jgi:hypothetical protein